jgi:hypothetical protein
LRRFVGLCETMIQSEFARVLDRVLGSSDVSV